MIITVIFNLLMLGWFPQRVIGHGLFMRPRVGGHRGELKGTADHVKGTA